MNSFRPSRIALWLGVALFVYALPYLYYRFFVHSHVLVNARVERPPFWWKILGESKSASTPPGTLALNVPLSLIYGMRHFEEPDLLAWVSEQTHVELSPAANTAYYPLARLDRVLTGHHVVYYPALPMGPPAAP